MSRLHLGVLVVFGLFLPLELAAQEKVQVAVDVGTVCQGKTVIAKVAKDVVLTVTGKQGDWLGVTWAGEGVTIAGWILAKEVRSVEKGGSAEHRSAPLKSDSRGDDRSTGARRAEPLPILKVSSEDTSSFAGKRYTLFVLVASSPNSDAQIIKTAETAIRDHFPKAMTATLVSVRLFVKGYPFPDGMPTGGVVEYEPARKKWATVVNAEGAADNRKAEDMFRKD